MKLVVERSALRGKVAIPGSKSHTIRAVALASLAGGVSRIEAPLVSADTLSAVSTYQALGAGIEVGECWTVRGTGGEVQVPDNIIDVGNSGTTLRFALGSAALLRGGMAAAFTGDDQIRTRPVGPLMNSLNDLGAKCFCTRHNGKVPAVVQGSLIGGQTNIEAISSQYLSSLLVNTPLAPTDTLINVLKLNERPYVHITMGYLDEQGIVYQTNDDLSRFEIKGGQSYRPFTKRIPADFSSATFFFCAGAMLDAELVLEGLDFNDPQGDKAIVDILRQMGAEISINGGEVTIRRKHLHGIEVDMNAIPDALPALSVVACFADSPSKLYNVPQARLKETDRIAVMAQELTKMGADIQELPDGLVIKPARLHATEVRGHGDHRVVMALSLAGMALPGTTTIDTAEAMSVTFPDYAKLMAAVGAKLQLTA